MFNTYTRLEKKSRSVGSGPVVNFLHYNKFSITAPLHGLSPEVGLLNSFQGRSRFSQGFWIGTVFRTLDLFGFSFGFGSVRFFQIWILIARLPHKDAAAFVRRQKWRSVILTFLWLI